MSLKNIMFACFKLVKKLITQKIIGDNSLTAVGILLSLQAGLRIGEVCALGWKDIDFNKRLIHIRHTVSRVLSTTEDKKTALILDEPKTKASIRDIPIPLNLLTVLLHAYELRCSEFVISSAENFVGTRTFDYQYRRFLKQNGFQNIKFHTLRHTYATRCAEAGIDAKTLSRLLGHSSADISLNVYVHPSLENARTRLDYAFQ